MNRLIILLAISLITFSCKTDPKEHNAIPEPAKNNAPINAKKPSDIKRAQIVISDSPKEDYPAVFLDNGFPIMKDTEVAGTGNTEVAEDFGASIKLNTTKKIPEIEAFYNEQLTAKGWKIKKVNVFKGASKALGYENDKYTLQIIIIDDINQDYRKMAVVMHLNPTSKK